MKVVIGAFTVILDGLKVRTQTPSNGFICEFCGDFNTENAANIFFNETVKTLSKFISYNFGDV